MTENDWVGTDEIFGQHVKNIKKDMLDKSLREFLDMLNDEEKACILAMVELVAVGMVGRFRDED